MTSDDPEYWRAGCECARAGLCYRCKAAAEIDRLRNELAHVRTDAVETVQFWGAYASEYFQQKHDLNRDIERLRGAVTR